MSRWTGLGLLAGAAALCAPLHAAPVQAARARPAPAREVAILALLPRAPTLASAGGAAPDLFAARRARTGAAPSAAGDAPPARPSAPAVAPPLPFTVLGKKLQNGVWEVYLAHGERTLVARPDTIIDQQYRVKTIVADSLTLVYLPLNQPQTLSTGDFH